MQSPVRIPLKQPVGKVKAPSSDETLKTSATLGGLDQGQDQPSVMLWGN